MYSKVDFTDRRLFSMNISEYKAFDVSGKLEMLLDHFGNSSRLAHKMDVSRNTIVRWNEDPSGMRPTHRLDLDVLFCDELVTPTLAKLPAPKPVLLPDDYRPADAIWRHRISDIAYGTYAIENPGADRKTYEAVIEDSSIPKGITKEEYFGSYNSWWVTQSIFNNLGVYPIKVDTVKRIHAELMKGVSEDAGQWAKGYRVMGKIQDIDTTAPEDIQAEVAYWCGKYPEPETLLDIAKAHSHFIRVHPFADGNGRVGRALLFIHCLNAGLMPPVLDDTNQAIYYSVMYHAMKHGQNKPLAQVLADASA